MAVTLKKKLHPLVRGVILNINNPHVETVAEVLCDSSPMTAEDISKLTHIHRDGVSKALILLNEAGLVRWIELPRNKIIWNMTTKNALTIIRDKLSMTLDNLRSRLEYERENEGFYVCPNGHVRYTLDEATEAGYICPECLEELAYEKNSYMIEELEDQITRLEKLVSRYNEAIAACSE